MFGSLSKKTEPVNEHVSRVLVSVKNVEVGRKHSVTHGIQTSHTADVT